MFEHVGRRLDPWYWFRMLVAAWLVAVGGVVVGYALLGYLFLRFLLWLLFALLALFLPVVNPVSIEEFLPPEVAVVAVEIQREEEVWDWEVDEPGWAIDDALPPLPPEPEPEPPRPQPRPVKAAVLTKLLGATGSEVSMVDLITSDEVEVGILGALSVQRPEATGSVFGEPAEGFGQGRDGVVGGVLGGVQGGPVGAPPASVRADALTFRKQSMPAALEAVTCRVGITFDTNGRVLHASPMGCPDDLRHSVRKAVSRWRIEPHARDGVPTRVRTTIQLPIDP